MLQNVWWLEHGEKLLKMRGKAMVSVKCKKRLAAGAPPQTPLGELTLRSPIPHSWREGVDYLGHFKHL